MSPVSVRWAVRQPSAVKLACTSCLFVNRKMECFLLIFSCLSNFVLLLKVLPITEKCYTLWIKVPHKYSSTVNWKPHLRALWMPISVILDSSNFGQEMLGPFRAAETKWLPALTWMICKGTDAVLILTRLRRSLQRNNSENQRQKFTTFG